MSQVETESEKDVTPSVEPPAEGGDASLWAALFRTMTDAIIVTDLERRVTTWGGGAEQMYGWRSDEAMGRELGSLLHVEYPDGGATELHEDMDAGRPARAYVSPLHKDGRRLDVDCAIVPLRDASGTITGYFSVNRDVSQQRKLISDLRAALAKVRALEGLLPICSWCRKVRDERGEWEQFEHYVESHTRATVSHGLCPECEYVHFGADRSEG